MTKSVFVVHGHNIEARDQLCTLLRLIGLRVATWELSVSAGVHSTHETVRHAMASNDVIIVLLTPDEVVKRNPRFSGDSYERRQPRPNVLFEAGWAVGTCPEKTLIVEAGMRHEVSDMDGFNTIRLKDRGSLNTLAMRLESTAKHQLDLSNSAWSDPANYPALFGADSRRHATPVCEQRDGYRKLCEYLETHDVKHAILVQHSCNLARELVVELIARGAECIDVYVQDVQPEDGPRHLQRIADSCRGLNLEVANVMGARSSNAECQVHWHRYRPPASLRAVLLDNAVLIVGWYTYRRAPAGAKFKLLGAETPGIMYYDTGMHDFRMLREFIECTAKDLRDDAIRTDHIVTVDGFQPPIDIPNV